jgi:hypothetical protein
MFGAMILYLMQDQNIKKLPSISVCDVIQAASLDFAVRNCADYLMDALQKEEAGQSCIIGGIEVEGFELGTVAHSVRASHFHTLQAQVNKP